MRLPKDPDNITNGHLYRALDAMWRAFDIYELRYDSTKPQEHNDKYYRAYLSRRRDALYCAAALGYDPAREVPCPA